LDASSSGVKPVIFTEDSSEVEYFMTVFPDHSVDVFGRGTTRYTHQVISKYDKDDFILQSEKVKGQPEIKCTLSVLC
jgi:hypothetical protein